MSDKRINLFLVSLIMVMCFGIPRSLEAKVYGTICGKVIAGDTKKPLKGTIIYLYFHDPKYGMLNPLEETTDREGKFCFKMLREGRYYLTYEAPHPYIGNDQLFAAKYASQRKNDWPGTIVLEKGKNVNITITVDQIGGSISGRVLRGDGVTPFPDVGVIAQSPEGYSSSDRSRQDGSYRCTNLVPSDNYKLSIQLLGYAEKVIKPIKVEARKDTSGIDIIVNTEDPTGIEGIVTTPDGKPLEDAVVGINMKDIWLGAMNFTDKEGRYSISGLEPGIYIMSITKAGQRKKIEGIIIEKGKKTKLNVVFDTSQIKQSELSESFSNKQFFF